MLTIKNKADVAEIYLSGDIVDDVDGGFLFDWRDGDTTGYEYPKKLRDQLDAIGAETPLEVHINSLGGYVFAGVAMANFISNHKGKTTCVVDGIAASIASQIFFSADVCKIPSNCYLMLHKPFSELSGNAEELRKAAEVLDTLQAGLETTYQRKALAGVTAADIHKMVEAETWMTGEEAAKTFNVKLLNPVKSLNAVGSIDKIKAAGIRKPPPIIFSNDQDFCEAKIKIALAKTKGLVIEC